MLQFAAMAVVWGLVGMLVGVLIAAQLYWPALNFDLPWLSFGRLRPLHTAAAGACAVAADPAAAAAARASGLRDQTHRTGHALGMAAVRAEHHFAGCRVAAGRCPAGTMLAFGLGTLPLMVSLTWSGARSGRWLQRPALRHAAGLCVLMAGVLTLVAPWLVSHPGMDGALKALGCGSAFAATG